MSSLAMSEFWGPKGWSWLSKFGGWGRAWWHNFSNSCGCWQVAGGCQHPGSLKPITEFWCLTLPACETRQNCFATKKPVRCVFCVSKLSTFAFRTHVDLALQESSDLFEQSRASVVSSGTLSKCVKLRCIEKLLNYVCILGGFANTPVHSG